MQSTHATEFLLAKIWAVFLIAAQVGFAFFTFFTSIPEQATVNAATMTISLIPSLGFSFWFLISITKQSASAILASVFLLSASCGLILYGAVFLCFPPSPPMTGFLASIFAIGSLFLVIQLLVHNQLTKAFPSYDLP